MWPLLTLGILLMYLLQIDLVVLVLLLAGSLGGAFMSNFGLIFINGVTSLFKNHVAV